MPYEELMQYEMHLALYRKLKDNWLCISKVKCIKYEDTPSTVVRFRLHLSIHLTVELKVEK